jgi:nucleoside-diphosphate-sugar epimerase
MKLLVLGGTKFLGIAVVEAALAAGHEVTMANRGQTRPELFPDVERIEVDLHADLAPLAGRVWDGVVDLDPTQLTRQTRRRAEALRDAVGHYVYVSSVSAYSDLSTPPNEDSPVFEPLDPEPEEFAMEHYGALKAGSERAILDVFGEHGAVIRAGLIVGPHDPTDRFTYWPRRLAEGGDVLAPGTPDDPVQFIDVRDLGAWLVHLAAERIGGVFIGTGPSLPFRETLERIAAAVGADVRLVWVDDATLLAAGVEPWMELPLWLPQGDGYDGMQRADISRAVAAGLTFRPLEEIARDTLAWSLEAGEQRPTLTRKKERDLIA